VIKEPTASVFIFCEEPDGRWRTALVWHPRLGCWLPSGAAASSHHSWRPVIENHCCLRSNAIWMQPVVRSCTASPACPSSRRLTTWRGIRAMSGRPAAAMRRCLGEYSCFPRQPVHSNRPDKAGQSTRVASEVHPSICHPNCQYLSPFHCRSSHVLTRLSLTLTNDIPNTTVIKNMKAARTAATTKRTG
jgi:hypothetical protein